MLESDKYFYGLDVKANGHDIHLGEQQKTHIYFSTEIMNKHHI